ncbi:MAG: antitoxin VapB family protein [Candidatus Woesearchaeota archaeon]
MTKVISISDDAYDYLKSFKEKDESFSKVIKKMRPIRDRKKLLSLSGALKDESFGREVDKIVRDRNLTKYKSPKFD